MNGKIILSINPGDTLAIYRQIVEQVKMAIAAGVLKSGDKLPTHRDLAVELVIAPLTVKKAYDTLEQEGLIISGRGRGTFIADGSAGPGPEAVKEFQKRLQGLVLQARLLGLAKEELMKAMQNIWQESGKEKS